MSLTKGMIAILCAALLAWGCASSEKQVEEKPAVEADEIIAAEETESTEGGDTGETSTADTDTETEKTTGADVSGADKETDSVEKKSKYPTIANPRTMSDYITNMAAGIADRIPEEEPWMIVVNVRGKDMHSERFEDAVSNALIAQLQSMSNDKQCFMVTTPEIRKRIMEEQAETLSDMYDEETGVEIGNIVRADANLEVPLNKFEEHMQLSLQLISVSNSAILWSTVGKIPTKHLPSEEKINPEYLYSSYRSGSHAIRHFPMPANTAGLKVNVDRDQVYEGQTYNIECSTRAAGYLYLFDLQTDGTLAVLLPNRIPIGLKNDDYVYKDNHLPANGKFTTLGSLELTASIAGKETILAVLTENELDVSEWEKIHAVEDRQFYWYTFGRDGTIRDCLDRLHKQLSQRETGYWYADWKEFSIVK